MWLLAAVAALSLVYWFRVGKAYESLALPRQIAAGAVGCLLLMAIWFTESLEKDARKVKLVWVIAILTIVAAPVVFLVTRDASNVGPSGKSSLPKLGFPPPAKIPPRP